MGVNADPARLPCGGDVLALVRQVSDGVDPEDREHQASCVHCQSALARIRVAMSDVRGLAVEPVEVPVDLARRVMQRLRAEQARIALPATERGRTSVNQAVVAQIARRAAVGVPGVVFASARMSDSEAEEPVRVTVRLVVAYGPAVEPMVGAVRERVVTDVAGLTGVVVDQLDVVVEDIS